MRWIEDVPWIGLGFIRIEFLADIHWVGFKDWFWRVLESMRLASNGINELNQFKKVSQISVKLVRIDFQEDEQLKSVWIGPSDWEDLWFSVARHTQRNYGIDMLKLWYTMAHVYKTHARREIQINISSNTRKFNIFNK